MQSIHQLPRATPEQQVLSQQLLQVIKKQIHIHGSIRFGDFFDLCLYHPPYGYYANQLEKFGVNGDFITAPELTPLFSYALAAQCAEIATSLHDYSILELGAGTGKMAADILDYLKQQAKLPQHYYLLERSSRLRQRQQDYLHHRHPDLKTRLIWLTESDLATLSFEGIILGNEIIDALRVDRFSLKNGDIHYLDVTLNDQDELTWCHSPADSALKNFLQHLQDNNINLPENYQSECCLQLDNWLKTILQPLKKGIALWIDYGYSQRDYYHPLRAGGTLLAHYQHHAHEAVFENIGLQDLTANVNFTALAEAAIQLDCSIAGYTTQALFLYGCGLDDLLCQAHVQQTEQEWFRTAHTVQQLILPTQMGERFQVMAMSKALDIPLRGFSLRDLRHLL